MTTPAPPQPTELQQASWARDAALAALEAGAVAMVLAGLRGRISAAIRSVTSAWAMTVGPVHTKPVSVSHVRPVVTLAHSLLDEIASEVDQATDGLPAATLAAYVLGVQQAGGAMAKRPVRATPMVPPNAPPVVRRELDRVATLEHEPPGGWMRVQLHQREQARIVAAMREQLDQAKRLLDVEHVTDHGFVQVQQALAAAQKLEQRVEAAVQWHLLDANQQGVADEARRRGLALIWVSERDACVVCQALSGDVVDPGQSFDVTATYGKPGSAPDPWPKPDYCGHPPRHNRCRCRAEPHDREDTGVVMALKREGRRAIVYGYRTDGQSSSERRDAADRLLARGARLPKTVEARARRLVKTPGQFGGPVPEFEP
jgi:hypothetical protein